MSNKLAAATLLAAIISTPAFARADPPTAPPVGPSSTHSASTVEAPRAIYRFTFTVHRPGDPRAATYVLALEENHSGAVSVGVNVPLSTASAVAAPRQDIGMSLHLMFAMRGSVPVVSGTAELSTVESGTPASSIHRTRIDGIAAVPVGRDTSFATLTDYVSHETFEITVSAARVM